MSKKTVIYNGVNMASDWPAKIEAAQQTTHYTSAGRKYSRIRYGDDNPKWGERPCRDCGVVKGQFHVQNCEYETCPICGESFAGGCTCKIDELSEQGEEIYKPSASRGYRIFVYGFVFVVFLLLLRSILMLFGI